MKIIEKTCNMRSSAMILVCYIMFPDKNSVSLRCYKTCCLKRFISCNSDTCVQTAIIIEKAYSMEKPCSKHVSMLNFALKELFRHENFAYSFVFSVCLLRPIRSDSMNKTAHTIISGRLGGWLGGHE